MRLEEFHKHCNAARKALIPRLGAFGINKRILVPKTVIVSGSGRHCLFTCLPEEEYRADIIGKALGVDEKEVDHRSVNTVELVDRVPGECSIILATDYLNLFETAIITDRLDYEIRRDKSIVSYSCGNQIYFSATGLSFLEEYNQKKTLYKESDIR